MKKPSAFNRLSERDKADLINAIKDDKYWKVSEGDKRYYFAVILTRGRTPSYRGRYVKVTGFKTVEADDRVAWFCRRYRVGVVDYKSRKLLGVLTWKAFKKLIKRGDLIVGLINSGSLPPYINEKAADELLKEDFKA